VTGLEPYSGGLSPMGRHQVARSVNRQRAGALIRIAGVKAQAQVAVAKVDALSLVTAEAMTAVTQLARMQRQLEQLAPEASGRLAYLAESHTLLMSGVLQDLRTELRER
jgi:hypothetical protein